MLYGKRHKNSPGISNSGILSILLCIEICGRYPFVFEERIGINSGRLSHTVALWRTSLLKSQKESGYV